MSNPSELQRRTKSIDSWILTWTRKKLYPLNPKTGSVDIADVAHHLANICRFTGATSQHYSVAQHCVLCARQVRPATALHALLHDSAEAYLGDWPRPWKRHVFIRIEDEQGTPHFEPIKAVEEELLGYIYADLDIPLPTAVDIAEVKRVDLLLLATEARDLMSPLHPDWEICQERGYPVLPECIEPWKPWQAEFEFNQMYRRLRYELRPEVGGFQRQVEAERVAITEDDGEAD